MHEFVMFLQVNQIIIILVIPLAVLVNVRTYSRLIQLVTTLASAKLQSSTVKTASRTVIRSSPLPMIHLSFFRLSVKFRIA